MPTITGTIVFSSSLYSCNSWQIKNMSYDPAKHYLGSLCKRNHEHEATGRSLRILGRGHCTECKKVESKNKYQRDVAKVKETGEKYYLGALCLAGHEYLNTGKSRRSYLTKGCVLCQTRRSRTYEANKKEANKNNPRYLGSLCIHGHDYEGTGRSLRSHLDGGRCVVCAKEKSLRSYYKDPVKTRRLTRENYKRNRLYYIKATTKWNTSNKERYRLHVKNAMHKRRTAIKDYKPISLDQKRFLYEICDYQCVYCGAEENLTLDHWMPLSRGGGHILTNLLIACSSCNSSKNNSLPLEWLDRQSYTKEEAEKIADIQTQLSLYVSSDHRSHQ